MTAASRPTRTGRVLFAATVAFLLSGDVLVLLAGGWAVAMFMRHAPGRLTDG